MLEFLMYKLQEILPDEVFRDTMSQFSINTAQSWLDDVRNLIGVTCYDGIKDEFRAKQEEERKHNAEMNCYVKNTASASRPTIFQVDIGADKLVEVSGEGVDNLFTDLFVGLV